MNEFEREFNKENSQKKNIAHGAYHRKGGSKSRKCSLPSDNLTEAQKRKLNGPVETVNLNQPMLWKQFKPLSDSLKRTYLMNLLNTYKPSGTMLGKMFGVTGRTAVLELHRLGLPVGTPGGCPTRAAAEAWAAFCNGVMGGGNNIISEANEQIEPENEQVETEEQKVVWDLDSPDHVNACRSEEVLDEEGDTILVPEAVAEDTEEHEQSGRACMTALSAEYEGEGKAVAELLSRVMTMFHGDLVRVQLVVEGV